MEDGNKPEKRRFKTDPEGENPRIRIRSENSSEASNENSKKQDAQRQRMNQAQHAIFARAESPVCSLEDDSRNFRERTPQRKRTSSPKLDFESSCDAEEASMPPSPNPRNLLSSLFSTLTGKGSKTSRELKTAHDIARRGATETMSRFITRRDPHEPSQVSRSYKKDQHEALHQRRDSIPTTKPKVETRTSQEKKPHQHEQGPLKEGNEARDRIQLAEENERHTRKRKEAERRNEHEERLRLEMTERVTTSGAGGTGDGPSERSSKSASRAGDT